MSLDGAPQLAHRTGVNRRRLDPPRIAEACFQQRFRMRDLVWPAHGYDGALGRDFIAAVQV